MFDQEPQRDQFEKVRLLGPTPGGGYSFETQRGDIYHGKPSLAGGHSPGDRLTVGYLSPGGMREPVILDGWAQTVVRYPKLASLPFLPRLTGLWTQWEGGPGLSLQPGQPGGAAFIPGFSIWAADQGQFTPGFNFPLLWSSPVLWNKPSGQHMALVFATADSDAEGAPLSLWLEVWGPADYPYLQLLTSTRLAGYPALGAHGVALKLGAPATYDWGGEFLASRLHYLPSTDQLLILGPGWDEQGRKDVFLCKSDGSLVRKSSPPNLLNSVATVAPYAIVTGSWANVRSVNYLTNAFSEVDEIPRLIRGFTQAGGEYREKWTLDPFSLLPSGGGIQVLKPCNTRASGRDDKRWPYATKSNVIAVQLCSGTGISREGIQSVNYNPPGFPEDRRDTHIWAGAKTTCFTFCSHLIAFLDAETGAYKHQSFDFVTGSNNRLVEEGTLGLAEHGLADGTATTYAYYYGWYPEDSPRTPENIREFSAPSLIVNSYREPLDYPDYNTMGSLPLTFPLSGYNTATGFGATKWGAGGTVTTAVRTQVGGPFDGQYVGAGNYGFVPGFQIGTGLDSEQPVNNPGGVFDDEDSHYCRYALPWIYVRGGNDCQGYANNISESGYEVPFDGYIGSTYYTLSRDSIICARVDQHYKTYLKKIPKAPDGKTWLADVKIEASQSWDVGTVNPESLYPLTLEHPRSCLEQSWALAPVVGQGKKIQRLLLELIDIRDSLDKESRPLLQVRDADTLALLGELEVCPVNLATATDADFDTYPDTQAIEGQYLYDSRGYGKPQMRAGVDTTVPGKFGEGGAVAYVAIYYSDRRNPGAVVKERFITIVFGGEYPAVAPTITTEELTLGPTEDFQVPRNFDTWAQGESRAYFREGNVFSGGM